MHSASSGDKPFRHWIIDDWCSPLTREQMNAALLHRWEVSYDNDVERGKRTSRNFIMMIPELQEAFARLRSPENVAEWIATTEIGSLQDDPYAHGAGLHLSTENSFLQTHVDYEVHPTIPKKERRLNFILFMHERWNKEWGGDLLLCDMSGRKVVEIEPVPGRLAVFECGPNSMHGVRVIKNRQAVRLSCAVYYLADARPTATRTRALFIPNRSKGGVPEEVS